MKLIPPQPQETEETKSEKVVTSEEHYAGALQTLTEVGVRFAQKLAEAVEASENASAVRALTGILYEATKRIERVSDMKEDHGHTASNRPAGRRSGSSRGNRKAATGSGPATSAGADGAPKRGRGRPKGSKNKATLAREAAERAERDAKHIAKARSAARVTDAKAGAVKKARSKPAGKRKSGGKAKPAAKSKPATKSPARKGGQTGGRKAASKKKGSSRKR